MVSMNKKAISGITLAAILVAGMFTFMPQSASADLTALDKIGTIINMLTNILSQVTEINDDLLLKKRFYQFVNDTDTTLESGDKLIAEVRVVSCAPELQLENACAFNVESILITGNDRFLITGPTVDGIQSLYKTSRLGDTNFLVDATMEVTSSDSSINKVGPIGVIGASESVSIEIEKVGPHSGTINKIEFNGEQPQGMELELIVTEEND